MQPLPFRISCYRAGASYDAARTVYALAKGQNAGKPGRKPWANSFAIQCDDEATAARMFGLLFALHRGGSFEPCLFGSVIPFITIRELRRVLRDRAHLLSCTVTGARLEKLEQLVKGCDLLDQQRDKMRQAVRHYARSIMRH